MSQVEIYLEKVRWVFGREFLMLPLYKCFLKCCYGEDKLLSVLISGTFLTCPKTTCRSRKVKPKEFTFLEQQRSEWRTWHLPSILFFCDIEKEILGIRTSMLSLWYLVSVQLHLQISILNSSDALENLSVSLLELYLECLSIRRC